MPGSSQTKLEWSAPAADDVRALRDYIALDSPFYARRFIERLLDSVESLGDFPQRGRVVPEAGRDDIREVIFHSYRIVYQLRGSNRIVILALIHGRRDITAAERKPWELD